jgi:hypothetical protein
LLSMGSWRKQTKNIKILYLPAPGQIKPGSIIKKKKEKPFGVVPKGFCFWFNENERSIKMATVVTMFKNNSQNHLVNQKIKSTRDLQQRLQEIFEESEHQDSVIVKLYKMLFPDWDKILRIEGFPTVGKALDVYIFNLFIEFDREHHPECFKGGAWLNQGFSSNESLGPWEISLENCKVIYS